MWTNVNKLEMGRETEQGRQRKKIKILLIMSEGSQGKTDVERRVLTSI